MNETEAIIERITQVNQDFQHLEIAVDSSLAKLKPGQSLLVRRDEKVWHPYLREHWWPVNVKGERLIVERPIEYRYDAGQVVNLIGPVGQPYRFRRTLRNATPATPNRAQYRRSISPGSLSSRAFSWAMFQPLWPTYSP